MRERADGNKIHAGLGDGADGFQIHAAAGFGFRAAIDNFHRLPQLYQIHVVEQNEVRAGVHSLFDLFQSVGFDFDFQLRKFFARALDGGGDGIRLFVLQRGEMIVLDKNHVEQADAMIFCAAASDSIFLKSPPAGRRFARVQNLRVGSPNRFDELRGQSGDAGKPLDKIQRDSFGAQNGARRAGDSQYAEPALTR